MLTYPQQPDTAPIALAMQSELRPIGIDLQIKQVDDPDTVLQQPTGWEAYDKWRHRHRTGRRQTLLSRSSPKFTTKGDSQLRRYRQPPDRPDRQSAR